MLRLHRGSLTKAGSQVTNYRSAGLMDCRQVSRLDDRHVVGREAAASLSKQLTIHLLINSTVWQAYAEVSPYKACHLLRHCADITALCWAGHQLYLSGAADGVAKSYRLQPPDWAAKCIRSCHRWRPRDQSFHPLLRGKTRSTTELGQRGECKRAMLIAVLHEIRPDFFDPVFPGGKDLVDLCDLARSPSLKETETSA